MKISGTVGTKFDCFGVAFRSLAVIVVLASAAPVHGGYENAGQRLEAVGQYVLVSANSQDLPAVVSENGSVRQEVLGGSVLLEPDGTSIWRTLHRYTESGRVSNSESSGRGSYSQQGTSIIFLFDADAVGLEGTLDGNTLTIQADVPMVYRKSFGADETSRRPTTDPSGGGPPPPPPPTNRSTFTLSLDPGYLPGSFEELCDSSILIVEAHVQSILAPRQNLRYPSGVQLRQERSRPIFLYLETDAILVVDRVLKGPESIRQVVISQKGGVVGRYTELPNQYDLIQQGERYILFLTDETEPDLPDVTGIPRFALAGAWTGLFRINESGGGLSPDTAISIREQFDGKSSQELITEIRRCSQAPVR